MTSRYNYRIYLTDTYSGIGKNLTAQTEQELSLKIKEQQRKWEEQEARKKSKEQSQDMKQQAERMDADAKEEVLECKNILITSLRTNYIVSWESMQTHDVFPQFEFNVPKPLMKHVSPPTEIQKGLLEGLFKSKREKREKEDADRKKTHEEAIKKAMDDFEASSKKYEIAKEKAHFDYQLEKKSFEEKQKKDNEEVLSWKKGFEEGDGIAIERYIDLILANSHYPNVIPAETEVFYDLISKTAIVSFNLPTPDEVPQIIGYKFVSTRKEIDPIPMNNRDRPSFYENIIQQVALRVIREVFIGVYQKNLLDAVVFNGWANGIDKSTGQAFNACILTVRASREEFEKINLERVEPKECLRELKALSAGPLQNLSPVKPLMELNREDKRFVTSEEVLNQLESDVNLATMPWADFEHLIRELFGKIFSTGDSEVRVTQASHDGGVDAIAFDSDPIRGGKFVIQAKRYNNVVPVSACRDLYGTMINEGAVKGILVTTSHFGNDSRTFVKDKPITLIDGSNLVHMLGEFGYNFRINLKEV